MTQRRQTDYSSTVKSRDDNFRHKSLSNPGLLSPSPSIEVSRNDAIVVNAFNVVTPDGIVIDEDTTSEISIPLTVEAKSYTIVLRHTLIQGSGGSAGVLETIDNLFPQEFFTDATIVGWLDYPGGSVPLDSTMIYFPRPLKSLESSNSLR